LIPESDVRCRKVNSLFEWNDHPVPFFFIMFKRPTEGYLDILKRIPMMLRLRGVVTRKLLLDRGFYTADIVNYLNKEHIRFLMRFSDSEWAPRNTRS
jgi:hypothetical protein